MLSPLKPNDFTNRLFLNDRQYGFIPKDLQVTIYLNTKILYYNNFNATLKHNIICTDLSKLKSSIISTMKSYLRNFNYLISLFFIVMVKIFYFSNNQIIEHQVFESAQFDITSIPLGDHLFILLFNMYLNDLPDVIQYFQLFLFDDNSELVNIVRSLQNAINLQNDIDNLEK